MIYVKTPKSLYIYTQIIQNIQVFYSVLIPNQQKNKKKKSWDQPYLCNLSKTQASPGKKHWSTVLEAALGPKAALESQSSAQFAWSNLEESIPQLLSWSWEGERVVYRLLPLDSSNPRKNRPSMDEAVSHSNPRSEKQHLQGNRQIKWY